MAILGIETLTYGVKDLDASTRFFEDFGLDRVERSLEEARFLLPEGSSVRLIREDHPSLPSGSRVIGGGVREVIWGVDTPEALDRLARDLARDRDLEVADDGTVRFVADFGVAMGLRVYAKKQVVSAPDQLNAPGHIGRLNQHRRWRLRARPKVIAHVVFAVPDYQEAHVFMVDRLHFRVSDTQRGFGMYLRADGTNNHHNFLLLNANAPLPEMDGKLRFHHANFGVDDVDEVMVGANHMVRQGWEPSHFGLGRHRVDSALFYYLPCPAGGEAEYGADGDYVDDSWVPRDWAEPLFAYAHFVHNLPPFLKKVPAWDVSYVTGIESSAGGH